MSQAPSSQYIQPASRYAGSANNKPAPNKSSVSATDRLKRELRSIMTAQKDKNVTVSAFPEEGNIRKWVGTIVGPSETPFEGLTFKLAMEFPENYPMSPPKVVFSTYIFHPNVDQSGNICLDILKEKWAATYDIMAILMSIQSLLGEPNNKSPLNAVAAKLWNNKEEYKKEVLQKYQQNNDVIVQKK